MVRMNELDKVEKEVVNCLGSAGKALEEIGKDKPSQKQVDNLVSQFMTSLQVQRFINYCSCCICGLFVLVVLVPLPQKISRIIT